MKRTEDLLLPLVKDSAVLMLVKEMKSSCAIQM
jgi:hypothetical protein